MKVHYYYLVPVLVSKSVLSFSILKFLWFPTLCCCFEFLRACWFDIWQFSVANQQTASIIDGKSIAEGIRSSIADEVRRMKESIGKIPGLAVILVGQRRDSLIYVHNKIIACEEAGIKSVVSEFPEDCSEDEVLGALSSFNEDPSIHGILVQLPLPQVIPITLTKNFFFSLLYCLSIPSSGDLSVIPWLVLVRLYHTCCGEVIVQPF